MSVSALPAQRSPSEETVRVLTLNLWGKQGVWPERRKVLINGIRELRPDLIAFQEPIVNDEYDQIVDLLGTEYSVTHPTLGPVSASDHVGVSIASRWPLAAVREVDLHVTPRTADFPCTTLIVEVAAPDPIGPLLFVNHLPSWQRSFEHEREVQTVAAARFLEGLVEGQQLHVVLAGDLDAVPDAASIRFWTGRQSLDGMSICYWDAWESTRPDESGHTASPHNPLRSTRGPGRRIDYIFVRCGEQSSPTLEIAACALAFNRPVGGVWASDHFGLVADLAVPARSSTA